MQRRTEELDGRWRKELGGAGGADVALEGVAEAGGEEGGEERGEIEGGEDGEAVARGEEGVGDGRDGPRDAVPPAE